MNNGDDSGRPQPAARLPGPHNAAMRGPPLPQRVTADNGPWPLHDGAASRAHEQHVLSGVDAGALMGLAGLSVARLALASAPHARWVQVWAGPGNNGGDGLVAARELHLAGKQVHVCLVADAARLPADAAQALQAAERAGVPISNQPEPAQVPGLVIDALLGLGASRAPADALAQAIDRINRCGAPVLAVDIPSGLHPDTGAVLGQAAVLAQTTLSLLTIKPGCFTNQGRAHVGVVWLDTLQLAPPASTAWLTSAPVRPARGHGAHKGSFGDVAVVGGAPGMVGAAWLAARAALAAGAGRVYCSLLADSAAPLNPARPELMSRAQWWRQPPAVLAATTVACGCGGGSDVRQALPPLLTHAGRLVLDADALNALADDTDLQTLLRQRGARGLPTVLTPHPLEAARLLACSVGDVQHDRLAAAKALSARLGATVLLKGSGTVIESSAGVPWINSTGNAALATAGTGDVLAGWLAGLWAQRPKAPPAETAAAAAWQHGRAADRFAQHRPHRPMRAVDLIEAMARER